MFYEYGVNSCTLAISCSTMVWVLINIIGCFLLKPVSVVLWYRWRLLCWCKYYSLECFINCNKLFALKGLKFRSLKKNVTSFISWSCKTLVWRWHWKRERRAQWRRHRYDVAPCVFFLFPAVVQCQVVGCYRSFLWGVRRHQLRDWWWCNTGRG